MAKFTSNTIVLCRLWYPLWALCNCKFERIYCMGITHTITTVKYIVWTLFSLKLNAFYYKWKIGVWVFLSAMMIQTRIGSKQLNGSGNWIVYTCMNFRYAKAEPLVNTDLLFEIFYTLCGVSGFVQLLHPYAVCYESWQIKKKNMYTVSNIFHLVFQFDNQHLRFDGKVGIQIDASFAQPVRVAIVFQRSFKTNTFLANNRFQEHLWIPKMPFITFMMNFETLMRECSY